MLPAIPAIYKVPGLLSVKSASGGFIPPTTGVRIAALKGFYPTQRGERKAQATALIFGFGAAWALSEYAVNQSECWSSPFSRGAVALLLGERKCLQVFTERLPGRYQRSVGLVSTLKAGNPRLVSHSGIGRRKRRPCAFRYCL